MTTGIHPAEADRIVRRLDVLLRPLAAQGDGLARAAARRPTPEALRRLADRLREARPRTPAGVIRPGDPPPRRDGWTPDGELRGLARAIRRIGGAELLLTLADPALVERLETLAYREEHRCQ